MRNLVRKRNLRLPISVIIPCKGHANYLCAAIFSVMKQNVDINEIIIIDDGDNLNEDHMLITIKHKDQIPISIYHHEKTLGASAARNTGFSHCRSPWVLPLDADDLIRPDYMEKAFRSAKPRSIVYPDFKYIGERQEICQLNHNFDLVELCKANFMIAGSLIPLEAWQTVKEKNGEGYNSKIWELGGFEDQLFYIECALLGFNGNHLSEPAYLYRQHLDNYSVKSKDKNIKEIRYFMKRYLNKIYQFEIPISGDEEFSHKVIRWNKKRN